MAKKTIDNKLKKIIVKYKNAIETDGVPIEKIIVFGSYAKGFAKKKQ